MAHISPQEAINYISSCAPKYKSFTFASLVHTAGAPYIVNNDTTSLSYKQHLQQLKVAITGDR